ncbi:hypothetical protein FSP39_006565 [Pinctada imbricata]|uniref:Uncharacterized protein n=1 Tax=Pinctada imbricata TaxID=66713 RepID=A0AA88XDQ7_PINIB|nr:hypothetical protein FSP39_006565 [Pinctada imbricata]
MKTLLVIIVVGASFCGSQQYDACSDPTQEFQGYTYTTDAATGDKIWSHCGFPNPMFDYSRCGLSYTSGNHYICDPDSLISNQVEAVDLALQMIETNTSTVCYGADDSKESYRVGVALINRIRIPDVSSGTTCINTCGEIHPEMNTTARSPTQGEKELIMKNFVDYLRTGWAMGSCGNDVVIFYSQELDMVEVSVGYKASSLVTDSIISYIKSTFITYKNNGRTADGLLIIAEKLRTTLRSITPAHILLILNMVAIVILTAFLVFFLHFRSVEFNAWGREGPWKLVDYAFYFLSGVWLVDGLLFSVIYISNKAPYLAVLFSGVMALVCIILYIFEEQVFTTYSNSGSYNFTRS